MRVLIGSHEEHDLESYNPFHYTNAQHNKSDLVFVGEAAEKAGVCSCRVLGGVVCESRFKGKQRGVRLREGSTCHVISAHVPCDISVMCVLVVPTVLIIRGR